MKLVHNVQKKQHRERSQTQDRSRFGLLEKKKDYRLRAADYHKKEAALKALRAKAATYNPDEYYHAMTRRETDEDGIIIARHKEEVLTTDQIKLLKTQDANYVRTMRLNELAQIKKQRDQLDFLAKGKHTVFVDSVEDQALFQPEKYFKTDKSMLDRRENRLRLDQLERNERVVRQRELDAEEKDKEYQEKLLRYKQLKARMEREDLLKEVEYHMDMGREILKKGPKHRVIDKDGNATFRFINQRKR